MNIGIVTLRLSQNYGGILQAYALSEFLKDSGHSPILINWKSNVKKDSNKRKLCLAVKKLLYVVTSNPRWYVRNEVDYEKVYSPLMCFINSNFDNMIDNALPANLNQKNFDGFIVGSDQVWRPKYFGEDRIGWAYLSFAREWPNVKRIGYSISFGTEEWEYTKEQYRECKQLVQLFNSISVRESSAIGLCDSKFNIKVEHTLDPTFFFTKDDYVKKFNLKHEQISNGKILTYVLNMTDEISTVINQIELQTEEKSFSVIHKPFPQYGPIAISEYIAPTLPQWLRGFYDAEYILTDSFHACVFAIIFNKPFVAFGNKRRGLTRFRSLLSMFNLQNQLIMSVNEFKFDLFEHFDWDSVNKIKEGKIMFSKEYLLNNLIKT